MKTFTLFLNFLQLSLLLRNVSSQNSKSASSSFSNMILTLLQSQSNRKYSSGSTSTSTSTSSSSSATRNGNGNGKQNSLSHRIKIDFRNRKNILQRNMLIEPSSTDIATSTSSSDLFIMASAECSSVPNTISASAIVVENDKIKNKNSQININSQYELSQQQFIYVILTR